MKRFGFLLAIIFCNAAVFCQKGDMPIEVTAAVEKKINQEIANEAALLKARLRKDGVPARAIAFALDTFAIEIYVEKYIDYDWSTAGMREATYAAAAKYDLLLNKYYKLLLNALMPADKAALINAQKSWIAFRDNELKLISTISKDQYSGGGTLQQLLDASAYLDIIKTRTLSIYEYYERATGNE